VRLTTLFRFRVVIIVTLALATFGCANAGTELTGPGGRRASLEIVCDSCAATASADSSAAVGDSSAVTGDSSAVAGDGSEAAGDGDAAAGDSTAVAGGDGIVADAPDEGGYDSKSGYVVAY